MASQHTGGWAAAEHAATRHREGVRLPGEWTGGISRGGKTGVETGDRRLETGSSYILEPVKVVRDWKRIRQLIFRKSRCFPEMGTMSQLLRTGLDIISCCEGACGSRVQAARTCCGPRGRPGTQRWRTENTDVWGNSVFTGNRRANCLLMLNRGKGGSAYMGGWQRIRAAYAPPQVLVLRGSEPQRDCRRAWGDGGSANIYS